MIRTNFEWDFETAWSAWNEWNNSSFKAFNLYQIVNYINKCRTDFELISNAFKDKPTRIIFDIEYCNEYESI